MFELSCASLNYAWGKVGADSEVAKLLQSADPSFQLDETQPYAEVSRNHLPVHKKYKKNTLRIQSHSGSGLIMHLDMERIVGSW